jgi:hypothetical protein
MRQLRVSSCTTSKSRTSSGSASPSAIIERDAASGIERWVPRLCAELTEGQYRLRFGLGASAILQLPRERTTQSDAMGQELPTPSRPLTRKRRQLIARIADMDQRKVACRHLAPANVCPTSCAPLSHSPVIVSGCVRGVPRIESRLHR